MKQLITNQVCVNLKKHIANVFLENPEISNITKERPDTVVGVKDFPVDSLPYADNCMDLSPNGSNIISLFHDLQLTKANGSWLNPFRNI